MSVGLVPIASKVSGSEDLINDGKNGYLINPNSVQSLVRGMRRVLEKSSQELANMRRRAVKTVEEHYNLDKIVDRYINLYQRLVR